jgi:hypothetical protein
LFDLQWTTPTNDIWLLINALFMFDGFEVAVEHMRPRMKHIIGLFPVVRSSDYLDYARRHPGEVVNEMDEDRTTAFFAGLGYELRQTEYVTFVATRWIRPEALQKSMRLIIEPFERVFSRRDALYWVGLFQRVEPGDGDQTAAPTIGEAEGAPPALSGRT